MDNVTNISILGLTKYTANPFTPGSGDRVLAAVNATLVYWTGTQWSVLGSGGGGGSTWEQLYANDNTFNVDSGNGFSIAGNMASANDVLTVTVDAGSSGDAIQITQAGSGADIKGTSNTWSVSKAGLATFAGLISSGTAAALETTGAAVWTILDNSATSLRIGPSGGPVFLTFDTSNAAEVLSTDALTFQVTNGLTELIKASNTVSALRVTNNTATTFGAAANNSGVAVIRSTSLTTGALLQLQLTEATLNGGFYLVARDVTGSANVFTIGEDGAHVIAGAGGNTEFTITAGDAILSDGSLAITDADNAATFTVTNDTATTASVFVVAGSGTFTGNTTSAFLTVTPSGLTTGTAVYLPVAALTTGKAVHVVANAATDGLVVNVTSSSVLMSSTGRLLSISHSGNATVSGVIAEISSAGADETTIMKITGSAALALGVGLDISLAAMTTGKGIDMSDLDAITTGKAIHIDATGTTHTDGILVHIDSAGTAITSTGRLLLVDHTGITTTSGVVAEFKTAATDETVLMQLTTAAMINGVALKIDGTTGMTTGSLVRVASSTAGAVATNGVVSLRSTGAFTSTTVGFVDILATAAVAGTVFSVANSAAQTTGIIAQFLQTGTTTGFSGSVVAITGSHTTGGTTLNIVDVTTTTGDAVKVTSNALVAGTSTILNLSHTTSVLGAGNSMLRITSTGIDTGTTTGVLLDLAATAAQAATLMMITSATTTSGIGIKIVLAGLTTGAAIDTTGVAATKQNINMNSSTGSTAAPQTNAPTGFFKIGIGGTDQWVPYYNAT